jgi:serine/threonine-protein kinase
MAVVVCPRCRAPNDNPPDANGKYRCVICEHVWLAEGALTTTQAPPRPRPSARSNPRISQEYLPDEPANEAARALTTRQSAEASGAARVLPPVDKPQRPASDMRPHSDRSHGGVIPPLKVLPPSPEREQERADAQARPALPANGPLPKVTPTTPTMEVDMDLFDRLEKEAQVNRSKQRTVAELTFEPAGTPSPENGRNMACPVCGHAFIASSNAKAQTCPQCHTTFDHASGRFATAEAQGEGTDHLLGKNIRGCVIDRKLGEGGMGSVYHARQLSLERSVAIKVLPPDLARNRNFIQRFEREAKSLAKINHPNILHIYDFGEETSLKLYFMIIEFVDGTDLGEVLNRRQTLPQLEVLDLLRQSAMGLEMAAAKGVIHRDIKPDNLMIAGDGICKVSDFGLAKGYGEENEVTSVGVRVGTPAFMSPEQCDGIEVDWRSDVYNLGCTAYLCLTGRLPFDGETPFSIMLKHKNDPIPSVREVSPSVDQGVDNLIRRMLAKKPADRCESWHALIEEIEHVEVALSGDPNIARKTRNQIQALVGGKSSEPTSARLEERRLPSPVPLRISPAVVPSAPASPATPGAAQRSAPSGRAAVVAPSPAGTTPGALPDWLKPVDIPSSPPPAPGAPAAPTSPSPSKQPPGHGSSRAAGFTAVPPPVMDHRIPSQELRVAGSSLDREGAGPGRASKRLNPEFEAARERGMRSESDGVAASAERLFSAGRFDAAAKEFRKAAQISPSPDHAERLRARAAEARRAGRWRRLGRRGAMLLVVLALAAVVGRYGTPQLHELLAEREYHGIVAEVRDPHQLADRLRAFANATKPYDWYLTVFRRGYAIAAVDEAKRQAEEVEGQQQRAPVTGGDDGARLRDLEAAYADPAVGLPEVLNRAAKLAGASSGREHERAQEIAALAQAQVENMGAELRRIQGLLKEGKHREALAGAEHFRSSFPRAGALAASLPLPAKLVITSDDGAPSDADVRVDGMSLPAGERRFCRHGDRETVVDIAAAGYAPTRVTVPMDARLEERAVEVRLVLAPTWTRALGPSAGGWAVLRPAADGVYVQRAEASALLRGTDGEVLATLEPTAGHQGASYTSLWLEDHGRLIIGMDDGQVRAVDPRTLQVVQVLGRGKVPVLAWMEIPLTYRSGERGRYLIEDAHSGRRIVATVGGQEWWSYQGISSAKLAPWLAHVGDHVVVLDDASAQFLEEDGSSVAQLSDLAGERIAPVIQLPGDSGVLVPTAVGVQWLRLNAHEPLLQPVSDQLLATAGPALATASAEVVALARADRGLDLAVVDGSTLSLRWHVELASPAMVAPGIGDGVVVAADAAGHLSIHSLDDGALLKRIPHTAPLAAAPLVRGGQIVVVDVKGTVAAYAVPKK